MTHTEPKEGSRSENFDQDRLGTIRSDRVCSTGFSVHHQRHAASNLLLLARPRYSYTRLLCDESFQGSWTGIGG